MSDNVSMLSVLTTFLMTVATVYFSSVLVLVVILPSPDNSYIVILRASTVIIDCQGKGSINII